MDNIDNINFDYVDDKELTELLAILEGLNDELDNIEGDNNEKN